MDNIDGKRYYAGKDSDLPYEDDLSFRAVFDLGKADFKSGYPSTWSPHLGSLAQDEVVWGIWYSGWWEAKEEEEDARWKTQIAWRVTKVGE